MRHCRRCRGFIRFPQLDRHREQHRTDQRADPQQYERHGGLAHRLADLRRTGHLQHVRRIAIRGGEKHRRQRRRHRIHHHTQTEPEIQQRREDHRIHLRQVVVVRSERRQRAGRGLDACHHQGIRQAAGRERRQERPAVRIACGRRQHVEGRTQPAGFVIPLQGGRHCVPADQLQGGQGPGNLRQEADRQRAIQGEVVDGERGS